MTCEELTQLVAAALDDAAASIVQRVETVLQSDAWTLEAADDGSTNLERRWTSKESPLTAVWMTTSGDRSSSFGLIVGTDTNEAAAELRANFQAQINKKASFRTLESVGSSTSWTDGFRDVHLSMYRAAVLHGKSVSPSVQFGVEPTDVDV